MKALPASPAASLSSNRAAALPVRVRAGGNRPRLSGRPHVCKAVPALGMLLMTSQTIIRLRQLKSLQYSLKDVESHAARLYVRGVVKKQFVISRHDYRHQIDTIRALHRRGLCCELTYHRQMKPYR